jgi:hypothetical protein
VILDLFGEPIPPENPRGRRKTPKPKGYYAAPGTGPAGHTCGDCEHHVVKRLAKDYHKCAKSEAKWTGGGATDIRVRSPACIGWERVIKLCTCDIQLGRKPAWRYSVTCPHHSHLAEKLP